MTPSPHDATIQALQTKVEKLQRELKRMPKPMQQKNLQPQKKKEGQSVKPQRPKLTEFRQPLQVQSHLEMPGILVQLGHTQRT